MRASEYEKLLPGAIAQIAFIPKYTQVKTTANIMKTSFATIIQEIIVLKKPLAPTSQPAADAPRTLSRAPSFSPKKKAKIN